MSSLSGGHILHLVPQRYPPHSSTSSRDILGTTYMVTRIVQTGCGAATTDKTDNTQALFLWNVVLRHAHEPRQMTVCLCTPLLRFHFDFVSATPSWHRYTHLHVAAACIICGVLCFENVRCASLSSFRAVSRRSSFACLWAGR